MSMRLRVVPSVERYLSLVEDADGDDLLVLGPAPAAAALAVARPELDLVVEEAGFGGGPEQGAGELAGPALAATAARAAAARSTGGTGHRDRLVIAVGAAGAAAAAFHLRRSPGDLLAVGTDTDLTRLDPDVLGGRSSVTLLGLADWFRPRTVRALQAALTGQAVPWGILCGRTLAELTWTVAKQHVGHGNRWSRHVLLHPVFPGTGRPRQVGPLSSRYAGEIPNGLLAELDDHPSDLVAITSHGDQADAYLGPGWLCSRPQRDSRERRELVPGGQVMRCWAEEGCYRAEAAAGADDEPTVFVRGDRIATSVLFLNVCHSLLVADGQRYHPASAVLSSCLRGPSTAVIATETIRRPDPAESALLSALLWAGRPVGAAVAALNRMQADRFGGAPVLVLFGDPELRIGGAEFDLTPRRVASARLALPAAQGHVSLARVRGLPDDIRIEAVGGGASTRTFLVPVRDGVRDVVVVGEREPLPPEPAVVLARPHPGPIGVPELREMQRQLDHLDLLSGTAQPEQRERVATALVSALRAAVRPSGRERTDQLRRVTVADLADEVSLLQATAVYGWTRAWSGAFTGEMLSLREHLVWYAELEPLDRGCPNCGAPLSGLAAHGLATPDTQRRLHVCPSCTVVADLPAGFPPLEVKASPVVACGSTIEVSVRRTGPAGGPGVRTSGAALVGARGLCPPAVRSVRAAAGAAVSDTVDLVVRVGPDVVPGVYSLRVVDMADLACSFFLAPVSVLPQPHPARPL